MRRRKDKFLKEIFAEFFQSYSPSELSFISKQFHPQSFLKFFFQIQFEKT